MITHSPGRRDARFQRNASGVETGNARQPKRKPNRFLSEARPVYWQNARCRETGRKRPEETGGELAGEDSKPETGGHITRTFTKARK